MEKTCKKVRFPQRNLSRAGDSTFRVAENCWGVGPFLALLLTSFLAIPAHAKTLELVRQIPHSGYSEGLHFHGGFLWNSNPDSIVKIDPKDGTVVEKFKPATTYSESIVWALGKLWNVSFRDNGLYAGAPSKNSVEFKKIGEVPEVHAWGIEFIQGKIVVTGDFSAKLYFLDPKNGKLVKILTTEIKDVEDLAWDGKYIWASSFSMSRGSVFRIDIQTGKTKDEFLLPVASQCPVIDGIAVEGKTLWITGKYCPSIYQLKLPE